MKILISGNKQEGLTSSIAKIYPDAVCLSRSTGYDLCNHEKQKDFAIQSIEYDVIIICSALWHFNQTSLLDEVSKANRDAGTRPHIICIGSTTDRVKNGKPWLYNAEKKALRDYCNTLSLGGVWDKLPKVTYISFGTLSNNQYKHPDRKCLDIDTAAKYIKWVIEQPGDVGINEISIDPLQFV